MGSNFATPEIKEDNIIDQIVRHNFTTVFMGDETWIDLFPKRFKRKYPHPSFNIQDLDSVDTANKQNLAKELKRKDWDLLVAHFLGVDHCGHKHGPLHSEMARKLKEMNQVIESVIEAMDVGTLLMVMGDHGMTITGDHGGESDDEVEALLFAYSKGIPLVPASLDIDSKTIKQIDLVSTMAAIFGVPVPYSNLGSISFQLLPDQTIEGLTQHQILLFHLWQNAKQIRNYFIKYSENNEKTFSFDVLEELEQKFLIFEHRVNSIYNEIGFKSFSNDLKENYLRKQLEICRNIWIHFNPKLMSQGLLISFMGVFLAFILTQTMPMKSYPIVFHKNLVWFLLATNIPVGAITYFLFKNFGMESGQHSFLFFTPLYNVVALVYLTIQNWEEIANKMSKMRRFSNLVPRLIFGFSITVFFSNSFVVQEQKILCYLMMGLLLYSLHEIHESSKLFVEFKNRFKLNQLFKSTFFKLILICLAGLILLRISQNYFKCREEQGNCFDFLNTEKPEKKKKSDIDLIPLVILALFVTITRVFLKTSGNLTGYSLNVLVTRYGPTLAVICVCGHFALSQSQQKNPGVPQIHIDALAWIVYLLFALEVLIILVNPLLIHIIPRSGDQVSVSSYSTMIPELFNKLKNVFNENHRNSGASGIPIVYGLATVYSSVFVAFSVIFTVLIALLLGSKVSNGLIILVFVAGVVLILNSIARYESTECLEDVLQPQFTTIVSWFVLMSFGFYATSHQPTISQIDWNAAFVGRTANFDNSNVISAALVILSTFCSNFLLLSVYPLIILFPFMMYAVYPNLSMKVFQKDRPKQEATDYRTITVQQTENSLEKIDFDVTRGEINLFENERLFVASVFKVGCQFIILQGLKIMSSMLACTVLCRHLMVWKIFAPRFIYEGIGTYASFTAITVGFLLLIKVHSSVNKLIEKINKRS